ncbi:aspartate/glutamate racemase family protein [Oribacterium sp. HCP28S3_H8]|uniref:aspartate/glutamate racemase family protein n=1 Tax=Oribacterium sp. HCP28S3_H8 TaxID=3438945 RepID=UPI003F890DA8
MKKICLIHTVKPVAVSFDQQLRDFLKEDVEIYNLWDSFLADNPNEIGSFTINNRNRLYNDIKSAEMTDCDVIVVTCSTLTPTVRLIRPFIEKPLIAIDDAMGREAVRRGSRILAYASAASTEGPMREKLQEEADKLGKEIHIDFRSNHEAFLAMKAMDMETHDRLLLEGAREITGYDVIVLTQASMAHLETKIQEITGIPTLSSPKRCMQEIKDTLDRIL